MQTVIIEIKIILKLFFIRVAIARNLPLPSFISLDVSHPRIFSAPHCFPKLWLGCLQRACQLSELSTLFVVCFLSLMTQTVYPRRLTSVDIKTTTEKQPSDFTSFIGVT